MKKDVIKETLSFKELTPEEKAARGILGRLYGPCADFINPTRNGRYYTDDLWEKVFTENDLVKEAFDNGGIPGELDHPEGREEIDSSKIAIIMPEAPKRDKNGHLIAYFDILDTPNGRIAYALAKYGYKLGISSRGTGDVVGDEVDPDTYEFKCFDLVLTPSVKDARLSMTESLNTKQLQFKKALTESLNSANADEKKVMEETLDRLQSKINLSLNEDIEEEEEEIVEENPIEDPIEETEEIESEEELKLNKEGEESPYEEKIKQFLALVYDGDKAPTDEETQAFVAAFISIFPKECFNLEGCADIEDETSEETIEEPEEANDEGSEELINSLQDALTKKTKLEGDVKQLQEQLAVSDTKVKKLEEENNKYKLSIISLSESAHNLKPLKEKVKVLEEELQNKKSLIENKEKSNNSLNESLSSKESEITKLNENLNNYKSQLKQLNEELNNTKKENESKNKLVEKWQTFARKTIDKYIETKAIMFGVNSSTIKGKLPSKYSIEDVDLVCENLQNDSLSYKNLPFELSNNKSKIAKVQITESKNDGLKIPSNYDDEVDDSLLDLAEVFKKQ